MLDNPWMLLNFIEGNALLWVENKQLELTSANVAWKTSISHDRLMDHVFAKEQSLGRFEVSTFVYPVDDPQLAAIPRDSS